MYRQLLSVFFLLISFSSYGNSVWPKTFASEKLKVKFYQPQISSFEENIVTCRSSLKILKDKTVSYGTVMMNARVSVSRADDKVTFRDLKIDSIKLSDKREDVYKNLIKEVEETLPIPKISFTVSQFAALLEPLNLETKSRDQVDMSMDAPEIIVSEENSFLVFIDGEPKLKQLDDSTLLQLLNTPELMVFDPATNVYYLYLKECWYKNRALNDLWTIAATIPNSIKKSFPDLANYKKESLKIFVRKNRAELIQTNGQPEMELIDGTDFLYVTNTDSNVFVKLGRQKIYVLLTGRWFSADTKEGPWNYVPQNELPEDFSRIPITSPKSDILEHVSGRPEAKDKVTETLIPETKKVDRGNVEYKVEYDGKVELDVVPKSNTLFYIRNSSQPTFKFGDTYFSCSQAVWYQSASPFGPWELATEIPDEIYELDPEFPYYYVKYVYVYDYSSKYVCYGYYPGYVGIYVHNGVVIYGTGYYYRSWCRYYYYPCPRTYWFGVYRYHWRYHCHWGVTYHSHYRRVHVSGPCGTVKVHHRTKKYYSSSGYKKAWSNYTVTANRQRGTFSSQGSKRYYSSGRYSRYDSTRSNSFSGKDRSVESKQQRSVRIDDNTIKAEMRRERDVSGKKYDVNSDTKRTLTGNDGNRTVTVDKDITVTDKYGNTKDLNVNKEFDGSRAQERNQNSLYSDKNGNVYKRDLDGWKQHSGDSWKKADKSAPTKNLNNQYKSRSKSNRRPVYGVRR